ncbi:MAG: ATP-binding cassette domain-containing protein [Armatimonadetes bacterium]|nr:ATP-binding cassette domain-containing protein [Armatimonadota bacterium]
MVPMSSPLLQIDGATLVKGAGAVILDNLSLSVAHGEHLALLGANGSGKTSLIGLLTRREWPLLRPDRQPVVRLFGEATWDVHELRRLMGIVTPEMDRDFVAERCTAREAVLSGFFAARGLWRRDITPAMESATTAALARLDVSHLADRRLDTMSTGEVRRILIARALVHRPPALLLDEPTAGLDLVCRRAFLNLLRQLADDTTILLVTHHVEEILPEMQRVVLLRAGRLVFDGPKTEALSNHRLAAAFGSDIVVTQRDGWYQAAVGGGD